MNRKVMQEYRKKIIIMLVLLLSGFHSETTLADTQTVKLTYPNPRIEFSYAGYKDYDKDPSMKRKLISDYIEVYAKTYTTEFLILNKTKENKFNLAEILKTAKAKINTLNDQQILQLPIGDYSKLRAELSWHASNLYNDKDYLNNLVSDIKSNANPTPVSNDQILKLSSEVSDVRNSLENNNKVDIALSEKLKSIEETLQKIKSDMSQSSNTPTTTNTTNTEQKITTETDTKSNSYGYFFVGFIVAMISQYFFLKKNAQK